MKKAWKDCKGGKACEATEKWLMAERDGEKEEGK
jgi:hypothetical protein